MDKPFLSELWNAVMLQVAAYCCESYRLFVFKIAQKQKKQTHIKNFGADSGLFFATVKVSSLYNLLKWEYSRIPSW